MSEEDDYLSDKFLTPANSKGSQTETYAERRRKARKESELKNLRGRKRSARELEEESRRDGLSKSLFERAKEDEGAGGIGKAMAMMEKMGYRPGQALGKLPPKPSSNPSILADPVATPTPESSSEPRTEPIAIGVWAGRKGLGLGKRALSPSSMDRASKAAKLEQDGLATRDHDAFRSRTSVEYLERRDAGRLIAARKTCIDLDDKKGKDFNVYWLNPYDPDTFPPELLEILTASDLPTVTEKEESLDEEVDYGRTNTRLPLAISLRKQMRADALTPISRLGEVDDDNQPDVWRKQRHKKAAMQFDEAMIEEISDYLHSSTHDKLIKLLAYLRKEYSYCFWCGLSYSNKEEMEQQCPGSEEELHD